MINLDDVVRKHKDISRGRSRSDVVSERYDRGLKVVLQEGFRGKAPSGSRTKTLKSCTLLLTILHMNVLNMQKSLH